MERKTYNTKQKNILMNFFALHPEESFSAADIIASSEIDVGVATVYRLLSKLTEEGKLNKVISNATDGARYQYHPHGSCSGHFHLRCTKCGGLVCTECSFMNDMKEHLGNDHGFTIDPSKTIIYGICKSCKG